MTGKDLSNVGKIFYIDFTFQNRTQNTRLHLKNYLQESLHRQLILVTIPLMYVWI